MSLDRFVQLHQTIEILYTVDGWMAQYYIFDGNTLEREVEGDTIEEALIKLEKSLLENPPKVGGPRMYKCIACRDEGQWYSPDNGQVVTCSCRKGK